MRSTVVAEKSKEIFKILFLSDTHLGFDFPLKPRVTRRRRGPDFFDSYQQALQPAINGDVDFVVHGGDMFFRSKVHPSIVEKAFEPLLAIADKGIPIIIVPGNHERANIPASLLETHPNLYIFHNPATFSFKINSKMIGFSGFPYYYSGIRDRFSSVVQSTNFNQIKYDALFLCVHHLFAGSHVGVQGFVFKAGKDVISPPCVPHEFDLVLSGHIHTAQKMIHDHNGEKLDVPILYAGSTERTSFAERLEEKGAFIINVDLSGQTTKVRPVFKELNTRSMYQIRLSVDNIHSQDEFEKIILFQLSSLEDDSVVQIKLTGKPKQSIQMLIADSVIRKLAPDTMNISFSHNRLNDV